MAHVKLRPLVIHEPAFGQPSGSDPCTPDSSSRSHCGLPATSRGKPLSPVPPEASSNNSAGENGVSKLRSKLRRLLGSGQTQSSSKAPSAAGPVGGLRCASSASLQDRTQAASVPVSPHVTSAARGARFGSSTNILSASASPSATTPPTTTPGSSAVGSAGNRPGPIPPTIANYTASGGSVGGAITTPDRIPSANSSSARPPMLRRAVSFSPNTTTFPPLTMPSPPPHPPGAACSTPGSAGPARGSLSSSNSALSLAARLSNMVVVPEDAALGDGDAPDVGRVDLGLPCCTPTARGGHATDIRPGRNSADVFEAGMQPHADCPIYVADAPPGTFPASSGGRLAPTQLTQPSPFGPLSDVRRVSSSSSSSTIYACSNNGSAVAADAAAFVTATPTPSMSLHVASWTSDASSQGPFSAVSIAAATAVLEGSSAATPRGAFFRGSSPATSSSARPEVARQPSSPNITISSPRIAPPHSLSSSHVPLLSSHSSTPQMTSPAALQPSPLSGPQSHAGMAPLNRGMSAFNLTPTPVGRSSIGTPAAVSTSNPWIASPSVSSAVTTATTTVSAGANGDAVMSSGSSAPTPDVMLASAPSQHIGAAGIGVDNRAVSPASKQAPIRRAFSTLDSSVKSEAPATPPGIVMALGASLPSEMKRKEWRMEDFTMLKKLYKGNYSTVHKALCRISMRLVVIKVYDTTRMTDLARNHVRREAALHAPLEHDNILNLYAVFSQGPYVMLIEEVAEGGDLYHVLKGVPGHRLQEDRAVAGVLIPLLRSLSYLHEQGICHRDIKLENILFSDRQHTRMLLADFGIALSLRQERAVTRAGTTEYMSPEQLRCPFKRHPSDNKDRTDLHYGLGVDVWATGVLTYELLHGYPPFLGSSREETEQLILAGDVQVAPQLSSCARDFILSCLQKDAPDRPTVMQLLQHTWVRQNMRQLRVG